MDDIAQEVLRHQYIYMPWEDGMDTVEAGKELALYVARKHRGRLTVVCPVKSSATHHDELAKLPIVTERSGAVVDAGVVLAFVNQDSSKLSARLWQEGVEVYRRLRQFKGAIERSGTEIIAVERFIISLDLSPGQHRVGARIFRVDRQGLFEQTPCVIERGFRASAPM